MAARMEIRAFRREDTEAVIGLWTLCGLTRPWNDPLRDIDRKLAEDSGSFLVAEQAGRVVGSVMAGFDGHRGWIYYLAVIPDLQGHGYGQALMKAAEDHLTAIGCPKIQLMVRASNTAVIDFYERLGYERQDVVTLGRRLIAD